MEKISLFEKYGDLINQLSALSHAAAKIDETNVYQEANSDSRALMDKLVSDNLLPGSRLEGLANFEDFYDQVAEGSRGLILMEHYSNTDLPGLCYLLEHSGSKKLEDLAQRIVAIAGMKLNEASPIVRAFAESFTRVVIYPSRSLSNEASKEETHRARKINLAAMRAMDNCKKRGQVILVFPAGTRYRPGHPETKRGLREIDSYLRLFDIVTLVSINGMMLQLQDENMLHDLIGPEKIIYAASPVIDCKDFRKEFLNSLPPDEEDPKQKMIDHVMEILQKQHDYYEKFLSKQD